MVCPIFGLLKYLEQVHHVNLFYRLPVVATGRMYPAWNGLHIILPRSATSVQPLYPGNQLSLADHPHVRIDIIDLDVS